MNYTTTQAAMALCLSPATLRKHREIKKMGHEILPGRVLFSLAEMEQLRRPERTPRWIVKWRLSTLEGPPDRVGAMMVWARDKEQAETKAQAWFWNVLLRESPNQYGTPINWRAETVEPA